MLELARREANASGIFFGSTTWSGNITLLALLGYGQNLPLSVEVMTLYSNAGLTRWHARQSGRNIRRRPVNPAAVHCLCRKWFTNAHVWDTLCYFTQPLTGPPDRFLWVFPKLFRHVILPVSNADLDHAWGRRRYPDF